MSERTLNSDDLEAFRAAVESLKLYRRADLNDPEHGTSLIEKLYVDPLPHEHVFKTILRPHTTFVEKELGNPLFSRDYSTSSERALYIPRLTSTLRPFMNLRSRIKG